MFKYVICNSFRHRFTKEAELGIAEAASCLSFISLYIYYIKREREREMCILLNMIPVTFLLI